MNLDFLVNLIMPLVFVGCLVVGYVLKHCVIGDNKYIPAILAMLGALLGCWVSKEVSPDAMIGGALSGLASTGAHQLFKQFLENPSDK